MAIARKPKARNSDAGAGVDVDALINKGLGSQAEPAKNETASVVLRIPAKVLTRIDKAVRHRPIKTPRHTWILEAIIEQLRREEGE